MIDTEEPTERLVQEAVFAQYIEEPDDPVTFEDTVSLLQRSRDLTYAEAYERVADAVMDGEVTLTDGGLRLPYLVAYFRLARRLWAVKHHQETGEMVPAHLPAECAVVRVAVADTQEMFGHTNLEDVIVTMNELHGWPGGRSWLEHALLNALDVGAVYLTGDGEDHYVVIDDDWHEGLGS